MTPAAAEPPAVRGFEPADAPALGAVYVAAARAGWRELFGDARLAAIAAPAGRWPPPAGTTTLVAELDGRVVGFAEVRRSADADAGPDVGELDTLYTDPAVWGRGAGRALMAAALARLAADGFTAATLWTAEANARPRAIYARAGWRPDGAAREKTYLGVTLTELRYRLALASARRSAGADAPAGGQP